MTSDAATPSSSRSTKTIPEFFEEAGDTDSMELWTEFWSILSEIRTRVGERFELSPHASSEPFANWTSGDFEGSLNTATGPEAEWVVHSWIGNRRTGILDMNLQVWLGPHIDVPHFVTVFGTIPQIFHYADFQPRRDLSTDLDYYRRYYDSQNDDFLRLRGDDRFTWSVSHGTYMRTIISPIGLSLVAERSDDVVATLRDEVMRRFETWLGWVDSAASVPAGERAALRARDHFLREHIYRLDPMNELAKKFMDEDMVSTLISARFGEEQLRTAAEGEAG